MLLAFISKICTELDRGRKMRTNHFLKSLPWLWAYIFQNKHRGDQIYYKAKWHIQNTKTTVKHNIHCNQSNYLSRNKSDLEIATNSSLVPQKSVWQSSTESLWPPQINQTAQVQGPGPTSRLTIAQPIHSLEIIPLAAITATWERICYSSAH